MYKIGHGDSKSSTRFLGFTVVSFGMDEESP